MIPTTSDFELVELSTTDKGLEEVMLCEYPYRLFPSNIEKDKSALNTHLFRFKSLKRAELLEFIKNYENIYAFEVKEAYTGNTILLNKTQNAETN